MIAVKQTTDSVIVRLTSAITTNDVECFASFRVESSSDIVPDRIADSTDGSGDFVLISSPSSGQKHLCDYANIYNADTVSAQVAIIYDANGTEITLHKVTLAPGEKTEYTAESGWQTYNTAGSVKTSVNPGLVPVTSDEQMVILETNVTNNEAVANTLKDVTGLSFDVLGGTLYEFEFYGFYTSAASTTGSRWVINGPTVALLAYESQYTLSASAITQNQALSTYNQPASCNATSITSGNTFRIQGWIQPSTDGTVQLRFASEVSASAIVCKAGSWVKYRQLT